jgi:hypothetical protein
MRNYKMVMSEEFFGMVRSGALDHWQGEVVPVRGPDRRIIGEATIVSVDHHDDGTVSVVVSSEINLDFGHGASIADIMRGQESMSFSFHEPEPDRDMPLLGALMGNAQIKWADPAPKVPHQPMRDDDVARWLKKVRDQYENNGWDERSSHSYWTVDGMLDEYRARADYGLSLDADLSELPDGW